MRYFYIYIKILIGCKYSYLLQAIKYQKNVTSLFWKYHRSMSKQLLLIADQEGGEGGVRAKNKDQNSLTPYLDEALSSSCNTTRLISIVSKPIKLSLRLCLSCLDLTLTLPWPCRNLSKMAKFLLNKFFWAKSFFRNSFF